MGFAGTFSLGLCLLVFGVVFLAAASYISGGALTGAGLILLAAAYARAGRD